MTEPDNARNPNDAQAVSIAGGSLFVIGLMLWFFTSGHKKDFETLRSELSDVKESLAAQTETLRQLRATMNTNGISNNAQNEK